MGDGTVLVGFVLGGGAGIRQLALDASFNALAQRSRDIGRQHPDRWLDAAVAGPLVWLGFNLADHVRDATTFVKDVQLEGLPEAPTWLAGIPLVGERLVGMWNTIDQQGAAMIVAVKPYLGQVGNWLLARSAQIGGGILELTLSIVFVFFFPWANAAVCSALASFWYWAFHSAYGMPYTTSRAAAGLLVLLLGQFFARLQGLRAPYGRAALAQ